MLNQHFNLVKPRSLGWGKVKVDRGMALEPAIVFGFVGIEIVENEFDASRIASILLDYRSCGSSKNGAMSQRISAGSPD
jgi:hypothetical protein